MKYIIEGGNVLKGNLKISGNKNSVFPCVAAALLTNEEVVIENVPQIRDVEVLVEILINLGVKVKKEGSLLRIKAEKVKSQLPRDLMIRLRGSVVLVGAILTRLGKVDFYHPGGDIIGKRGINVHLEAFKAFSIKASVSDLKYTLKKDGMVSPHSIFLAERSVTATENLILFASLLQGEVLIRNCALEPHVVDLCRMLTQMGVKISGLGTDTLKISGSSSLRGTKFRIRCDYIELGTYAVAAAITGGEIRVDLGNDDTDLDPVLTPLAKFGLRVNRDKSVINFEAAKLTSVDKLVTNTWPGFPTDLMSAAIVLASQSRGVTLCHDWMFESRMFFADKLINMGANIIIADPHRVLVYGPAQLKARDLETPDIRAGMALVLASLIAKGKSLINRVELIERGYEDVVGKLTNLGAKIKLND